MTRRLPTPEIPALDEQTKPYGINGKVFGVERVEPRIIRIAVSNVVGDNVKRCIARMFLPSGQVLGESKVHMTHEPAAQMAAIDECKVWVANNRPGWDVVVDGLLDPPARRAAPERPDLEGVLDLCALAMRTWQEPLEFTFEQLHQLAEGAAEEIARLQRENEQLKKRAEHLEVAGMLDRQLRPNPPGPSDRDVETDFVDQDAVVVDVTPLTPDEIAASVRAHRLFALPGRDPLVALADICREWVETVTAVDDGRRDSVASVQRQLSLLERQDALEIAIKKASAK